MSIMEFSAFDRQLLKLASKSAVAAARTAKKAAQKALLTEAESEAHAMEGYAEEAARFLDNPDGPDKNDVHLVFGHRVALRTGCIIRIAEIEGMVEEQTDVLIDADGISSTERRASDFRRLEQRLRTMDGPQSELPLSAPATPPTEPEPPVAADPTPSERDGPLVSEGPFDAEPIPERLALAAGVPDDLAPYSDDVPDADFELVEPGAEGEAPQSSTDSTSDFALADDDDEVARDDGLAEDADDEVSDEHSAAGDDVEAWLNTPLRTTPADGTAPSGQA